MKNIPDMTPIKRKRIEEGRTNRWLAHKCGVDEATMSRIVNGKTRPDVVLALKISRALNCSVEELWSWMLAGDETEDA